MSHHYGDSSAYFILMSIHSLSHCRRISIYLSHLSHLSHHFLSIFNIYILTRRYSMIEDIHDIVVTRNKWEEVAKSGDSVTHGDSYI